MRLSKLLLIPTLALALTSCRPSAPPNSVTPSATPSVPKRVVSLIPSATELIYEIGAGSTLVGVTVNDDYPEQVRQLPKVGDQTIDPERLVTLKPDLIVLDTEFNKGADKYRQLGFQALALKSKRLSDISENLKILGKSLGREEDGVAASERFDKALASVPRLDTKEKVIIEIWGSPLMTVGADTLPDDLLDKLGLRNAYADQKGYFQVDPEDVVTRRPSIVILPSGNSTERSAAAELLRKAGVPVKLIVLDGDTFTNPTPRVLQGMRTVAKSLSPPR